MLIIEDLDRSTPEEAIAELVDVIKQSPERRELLVQMLQEQASFYEGRAANATAHLRGYILAAFEQTGLPAAALPLVLEELESGHDAYSVAGAAKALRGLSSRSSELVPFLLKAVENIKGDDDAITFEQYRPNWPLNEYTTALGEILQTLGWLGPEAQIALPFLEALSTSRREQFSRRVRRQVEEIVELIRASPKADDACSCTGTVSAITLFSSPRAAERIVGPSAAMGQFDAHSAGRSLDNIELEDQDGNALLFGAFFSGKPAVLVFFYTRCENPNKCALTISKLASLQESIVTAGLEGQIRTAAITYDPEFDLPPRLKAYGLTRGVHFSADNRIFRTKSGFHDLRQYFNLGVSYGGPTVNRHTIELFVLDSAGKTVSAFSRLQWDVQEVLGHASALLEHTHAKS